MLELPFGGGGGRSSRWIHSSEMKTQEANMEVMEEDPGSSTAAHITTWKKYYTLRKNK